LERRGIVPTYPIPVAEDCIDGDHPEAPPALRTPHKVRRRPTLFIVVITAVMNPNKEENVQKFWYIAPPEVPVANPSATGGMSKGGIDLVEK
jgi:hypothetical protein